MEAIDIREEVLLRYLHERSKLRADGTVRPEAFMPMFNATKGRWETSTFRRSVFDDLWEAGARYCEELRPVKAVAMLEVEAVTQSELDIDLDDDLPGHVSIIGWPADPLDPGIKARHKQLAQRLARQAIAEVHEV